MTLYRDARQCADVAIFIPQQADRALIFQTERDALDVHGILSARYLDWAFRLADHPVGQVIECWPVAWADWTRTPAPSPVFIVSN